MEEDLTSEPPPPELVVCGPPVSPPRSGVQSATSLAPELPEPLGESPEFSYIVVNYLSDEYLAKNLDRALEAFAGAPFEVKVVDNSASIRPLKLEPRHAQDPRIQIVAPYRNLGFGRAVSLGVRRSRGQYLLVANPDAFLAPEVPEALRQCLEENPEAALVGPRIFDANGKIQESARRFPRIRTGLFGRTSILTRLFPSNPISKKELLAGKVADSGPVSVDWVSGACFMIRREDFEEVGGFDKRYWMYWEDADLCYRLKEMGKKTVYLPDCSIRHLVGRSAKKAKLRTTLEFHRSAYRFYFTKIRPKSGWLTRLFGGLALSTRAIWVLTVGQIRE